MKVLVRAKIRKNPRKKSEAGEMPAGAQFEYRLARFYCTGQMIEGSEVTITASSLYKAMKDYQAYMEAMYGEWVNLEEIELISLPKPSCHDLIMRLAKNAKVFSVVCKFCDGKTAIVEVDEGVGSPETFTYVRKKGKWVIRR